MFAGAQSTRRQKCYSNRRFSGAEVAPALPPGWAVVGRGGDVAPEGAGPPGDWRRRAGREGAGALTMAAGADADSRRAALETATVAPERGGGSCVLCCGDLEATALGRCDHPVCYRCSTKMRVLCEQRYCAVCREELRQVRRGRRTARSGRRGGHGGAAGRGGTGRRAYGIRKETFLPGVHPPA